MGIRFDPRNAAKQCAHDNIYLEGRSYEFGLAIDKKFGKGTAAWLYKLSKTIKLWEVKELEQLLSAARHSYLAYTTLYDELTHVPPISEAVA
jgi:hypothetical protein